MSLDINTWIRAYRALEATASASRGTTSNGVTRVPSTTCSDVIAIAVIVDPYVRALSPQFFRDALLRRWIALLDDLRDHALITPTRTYPENSSFWSGLSAVCIGLEFDDAPLPSARTLDSLLTEIADVPDLRNMGPKSDGPFKHFDNIKTYDDLFIAQLKHLRELHGIDPTTEKTSMPSPRATNDEVVQLADYWQKLFSGARVVSGHGSVAQRWKAALADVESFARKGDPYAVYPKNLTFWAALRATAIQVALADESPTKWDLATESIKDSIKNLPENIKVGTEKAASALASAASDVAQGAAKIANEAGKGLFAGFGTPLLVGAGLLGLFLISRNNAKPSAES